MEKTPLSKSAAVTVDTTRMGQLAISLTMLRTNKLDMGLEVLEEMLDSDLMTLAGQLRSGQVNVAGNKAIQIVRDYRSVYPRNVDTNINVLVEEVFSRSK